MQLGNYPMFEGKAEAAFTFYAQCLRGKITRLVRFGETPDGGEMPCEPRFWAARFGMLVDQFGVSWMVNFE